MEWTDLIKGGAGSVVISSTDTVTGDFGFIVVNADAVFNGLLDENGDSVMTEQGLTGVTIKSGIVIVPQTKNFSSIDLVSGSVVAYKRG